MGARESERARDGRSVGGGRREGSGSIELTELVGRGRKKKSEFQSMGKNK
jgi:hypothetical protein